VPIISALEKLHEDGYVHGDIRGFNTVFTSVKDQGWLIDFDFGGKEDAATTVYPTGYKTLIADGLHLGIEEKPIEKWEDWFALGELIFKCHRFKALAGADTDLVSTVATVSERWENLEEMNQRDEAMISDLNIEEAKQPDEVMIAELISLCLRLSKNNWVVEPRPLFKRALALSEKSNAEQVTTNPAATGSPPTEKGARR
jgi:hypothetical protein